MGTQSHMSRVTHRSMHKGAHSTIPKGAHRSTSRDAHRPMPRHGRGTHRLCLRVTIYLCAGAPRDLFPEVHVDLHIGAPTDLYLCTGAPRDLYPGVHVDLHIGAPTVLYLCLCIDLCFRWMIISEL